MNKICLLSAAWSRLKFLAAFLLLFSTSLASAEEFAPPLFAFQTGFSQAESNQPEYLVELVKSSGFAGVELMGLKTAERFLPELKQRDLKLYSLYLPINLDTDQPYPEGLENFLKNHQGDIHYLWFHIHSQMHDRSDSAGDQKCVEVLRELSDLVKPYDVKIGIYHHVGFWAERFSDGVRVSRKVDRENVGAVFNLCHYLRKDGADNLEQELAAAFPHVMLVSINGADDGETTNMGWDRLIQPLDQGTFDIKRVLKVLKDKQYSGPIGLQGYGIKQKPEEFFPRSVHAYREALESLNK